MVHDLVLGAWCLVLHLQKGWRSSGGCCPVTDYRLPTTSTWFFDRLEAYCRQLLLSSLTGWKPIPPLGFELVTRLCLETGANARRLMGTRC